MALVGNAKGVVFPLVLLLMVLDLKEGLVVIYEIRDYDVSLNIAPRGLL